MTPSRRHRRRSSSIGLRAKVLAGLFAVVIAFGLCEIGVRLLYPTPPEPGREPQILYRVEPEVGFVHVPNQVGFLDDGLATINTLGLRGELPADPKPQGEVRVLAIGDSTTFGWGVGDSETYVVELERLLRRQFPDRPIEVINGGVAAYDLKKDARLLKRLAVTLKPDIVLVGVYWNDLPYEGVSVDRQVPPTAGASEISAASAAGASSSTSTFRLANQPSGWNRLLRSSRVLYTLRHAWLAVLAPTSAATNQVQWEMALLEGRQSPAIERAWADVTSSLTDIRDLGVRDGFAVGVFTIPIRAQVEKDFPKAQYQTRVKKIADALGMFTVDPLPALLQQVDRERLFIPYDRIHFSTQGNAELAQAAFDVLRERPEFRAPAAVQEGGGNGEVR